MGKRTQSDEVALEYCAARYLGHWVSRERELHAGMSKSSALPIRVALQYFKVQRGFKGLGKPGSRVPNAVEALVLQMPTAFATTAEITDCVTELSLEFKGLRAGGDQLLSAASKLMWLRLRAPVLVYDARAVRSLRSLRREQGLRGSLRSYSDYFAAWHEQFELRRTALNSAAASLPHHLHFTPCSHTLTPAVARKICSQRWFLERTFDQYLWHRGGS